MCFCSAASQPAQPVPRWGGWVGWGLYRVSYPSYGKKHPLVSGAWGGAPPHPHQKAGRHGGKGIIWCLGRASPARCYHFSVLADPHPLSAMSFSLNNCLHNLSLSIKLIQWLKLKTPCSPWAPAVSWAILPTSDADVLILPKRPRCFRIFSPCRHSINAGYTRITLTFGSSRMKPPGGLTPLVAYAST
ncbi:hypothetical protein ES708_26247 [subsurface metagenome]